MTLVCGLLAGAASDAADPPQLTAAQESALRDYVVTRYHQIKASREQDRKAVTRYLAGKALNDYGSVLPSSWVHDEFDIAITSITPLGCETIPQAQIDKSDPDYQKNPISEFCQTKVRFQTRPVKPADRPVQLMVSTLTWGQKATPPKEAAATASDEPGIEILRDEHEPGITLEQQTELSDYIQARYRRIKATVDQDRQAARRYLTDEAWEKYTDEFHPETAIPHFKSCAECEEFAIDITQIKNEGCSIIRDAMNEAGDEYCHTFVEFRSRPLKATAKPQLMASDLAWRPRDGVHIPPGANLSDQTSIGSPIVITKDEQLEQRHSVADCLPEAASGDLCN